MKNEKIIYSFGTIMVITGEVMKIMHIPYGNSIFMGTLISMTVFQAYHIIILKKEIEKRDKTSDKEIP